MLNQRHNLQTYDKTVIPALVSSMREFFDVNAALQVLVAATIRNEQTFEAFVQACSGSPLPPQKPHCATCGELLLIAVG